MAAFDFAIVSSALNLSLTFVNAAIAGYTAFRKSNVEEYFRLLLDRNVDLSLIERQEELQRQFYIIIEKASLESRQEKLKKWAILSINMCRTKWSIDRIDDYIRILDDLTVFDLRVLEVCYLSIHGLTTSKDKPIVNISMQHGETGVLHATKRKRNQIISEAISVPNSVYESDLLEVVDRDGRYSPEVSHLLIEKSLTRLVSHSLISEDYSNSRDKRIGTVQSTGIVRRRMLNQYGVEFLEFLADELLSA